MSNTMRSCALWVVLTAVCPPSAALAQGASWQFGSAPSFTSGKYGSDARTDVFFMPFTARRLFADGDITLVFPYVCIWGNAGVTVVNGAPVRQEPVRDGATRDVRGDAGTTRGGTPTRPGAGSPTRPGDAASGTRAPEQPGTLDAVGQSAARRCGPGDIVARGRYYLLDERGWAPTLAVRAHVKAPTAEAGRGLGTGRPDEGFGIEVSRTFPGAVLAMADAGYTIVGKPAGAGFRNTWWYDVGIGKNLAGGAVSISLFFEEYSAIVPGFVAARDILAALQVIGAGGWRVQLSGELGLSDGAPERGFTFGASRRF
jgi:hypothetical protein